MLSCSGNQSSLLCQAMLFLTTAKWMQSNAYRLAYRLINTRNELLCGQVLRALNNALQPIRIKDLNYLLHEEWFTTPAE